MKIFAFLILASIFILNVMFSYHAEKKKPEADTVKSEIVMTAVFDSIEDMPLCDEGSRALEAKISMTGEHFSCNGKEWKEVED
ncbi:MAG: hypothetical protein EOP06_00870 [Proteobacteria bacterium]|nr:MAG: hypothetical protein EOP06_00870 [Pseudomonadota bacterium]